MAKKKKAHRVKVTGMQTIMAHIMPNRTDSEVYLSDTIDATELVRFIQKKNEEHPEYKTTIFHCVVTALARMVKERPMLNRYVQGRHFYEREDISIGFTCKRQFTDHAEEFLMFLVPKEDDVLDNISRKIVGDVKENRDSKKPSDGVNNLLDSLAKLPRLLLMLIGRIVRWLDFWGLNPSFITAGDPNYATILCSNLGSIKCPSVYHHLNNYGTNSIMITIGTLHKEEILMPDGHKEIRDVIDIGATLDERIGDGFYFARSLKLVKHIFAHPELLDLPLNVESGFDYK